MGEEAVKKLAEEKKKMAAFLSEARIEIPEPHVAFSDPCPCCGNKKRRCLHPPATSRKRRLIFNSADAEAAAAAATSPAVAQSSPSALTPSSARSFCTLSDSLGSPASATTSLVASSTPPLPPPPQPASAGGPLAATPTSAAPPTLPPSSSDRRLIERAESNPEAPLICNSEEVAAAEGPSNEEVRVGIKCRCGVIREILLIR